MKLHEIQKPKGATASVKRVGRGDGSGIGKTSGRGANGQKSRSGYSRRPGFEGGQMPLIRRLPKRGFTNRFRVTAIPVNLYALEAAAQDGTVTPDLLTSHGKNKRVKILGTGTLTHALTVKAHAFSATAKDKIEKAGGKVEIIPC